MWKEEQVVLPAVNLQPLKDGPLIFPVLGIGKPRLGGVAVQQNSLDRFRCIGQTEM